MLGIVVGVASVVLLTSIGEGTRLYVVQQFTQFGTNLVAITPGKVGTSGIPGFLGGTTRKLTLEDARALGRVAGVQSVMPSVFGMAQVESGERGRHVYIYGVTAEAPEVYHMKVQSGRYLPEGDPDTAPPVCVLGPTLKRELFGEGNPLSQRVRIGGVSFQVVGVMEPKGTFLGIDIDDTAYIPVRRAMRLFNRDALSEIDLQLSAVVDTTPVVKRAEEVLRDRHEGEEDFTVTTQSQMLDTAGRVLRIITMAVVGIAAISLFVGAMGILTILWVAVHERTGEIGLSMALGATREQILTMFLSEATILACLGGFVGVFVGVGGAYGVEMFVPGLPLRIPPEIVVLAVAMSTGIGLAAGVIPALRASRMDPVEALRGE